jgi:uncharacterized SAM-binding protein YcdF (DUF218 family)
MPLTIFWLILLAWVIFYLLKRKRAGLVCGFFSIVWLAMISFPFIPELLVRSLETRYPSLLDISQFNPKDSVYILVLGAGYTDNKNLPPNDQLSLNALGPSVGSDQVTQVIECKPTGTFRFCARRKCQ